MIKAVFPLFSLILAAACSTSVPTDGLVFDASSGKAGSEEQQKVSAELGFKFNSESRGRFAAPPTGGIYAVSAPVRRLKAHSGGEMVRVW